MTRENLEGHKFGQTGQLPYPPTTSLGGNNFGCENIIGIINSDKIQKQKPAVLRIANECGKIAITMT